MAKRVSGIATIAKSAMLWLFLGVVIASTYGAILGTRDNSLNLSMNAPEPVLAAATSEEIAPD